MEREQRNRLAALIRGQRWAALATHGGGNPLASMVAFAQAYSVSPSELGQASMS